MGRLGTALVVLFVALVGIVGVAMATGHGGFIKHMAASARSNAGGGDYDEEYDEDSSSDEEEPARRSEGLKAAYRRLASQKAWARFNQAKYGSGEYKPHKYCFGLVCKKKPKHERDEDEDEESDEE